jgi:hypothetical protein
MEIEGVMDGSLFERSCVGIAPNELGRWVIRYAWLLKADVDAMVPEVFNIRLSSLTRSCSQSRPTAWSHTPGSADSRVTGPPRRRWKMLSIAVVELADARLRPLDGTLNKCLLFMAHGSLFQQAALETAGCAVLDDVRSEARRLTALA